MNPSQTDAAVVPEQAPDANADLLLELSMGEQAQLTAQFGALVAQAGSPELLFIKVYNALPSQQEKDQFVSQLKEVAPLLGIKIPKMKTGHAKAPQAGSSRSRYKV